MTLCTVSGTLTRPDGSPLAFLPARFTPAPTVTGSGPAGLVAPMPVVAATDATGALSVDLRPGVYSVTVERSRLQLLTALLDVPAAATADIEDILVRLPGPPSALDAAAHAARAGGAADRAETAAAAASAGRPPQVEDFGGGTARTGAQNVAAANACLAAYGEVNFGPGTYTLAGSIVHAPTNATGQAAGIVRGAGNGATILLQENHDADTLRFVHADPARVFALRPQVRDLSIHYVGATAANTGAAIRHRQALNGLFENITIDGPTFGIVAERGAQCWHDKVYFRSALRASGQLAEAAFVFDHDPAQAAGMSFGNFMSNVEVQTGVGTRAAFLLRAVDGLKIVNSHFDFCERHLRLEPDGTGGRTGIMEVMLSNCYLDQNAAVPLQQAIFVRVPGAANSANIAGLQINGGILRGPDTARVFAFDQTAGGLSGLERLRVLRFHGVEMRGFSGGAIDLRGPAGFVARTRLWDVQVQGCAFNGGNLSRSGGPVRSHGLILAGRGISVQGNIWRGNWSADGERPILVSADSDAVAIHGDIFNTHRLRDDNVEIEAGATSISLQGLGGEEGLSRAREIASSGGTGDNWWIRYSDGRQECGKRFTKADIEVSTAFGAMFRSDNLLDAAESLFPVQFLTGTLPTCQITAYVSDAQSFQLVGGVASRTSWPTIIRVASPVSLSDRTVNIELRAEGRWR